VWCSGSPSLDGRGIGEGESENIFTHLTLTLSHLGERVKVEVMQQE
jgi:hypothetical protein